jgi:hypothetical protein
MKQFFIRTGALGLRIGLVVVAVFMGSELATAQFDDTPTSPLAISQHGEFANFDIQIYHSGYPEWYTPPPVAAQHGPNCEGPPATHQVTTFAGAVYICNKHLMTSMDSGYGEIVITPNRLLDWTNGPATVEWEMSTEIMSRRDWVDVVLSPFVENAASPYDVGAEEFPKTGYQIRMEGGFFLLEIKDHLRKGLGGNYDPKINSGIKPGTNQSAQRQPFKLTVSKTNIKMERLESATGTAIVFFDRPVNTAFTQAVVQFAQHSYAPDKDNSGVPATWHWDEFKLTPSVPFTLIKADKRIVPSKPGGNDMDVHFQAPAPANSFLRFSAQAGRVQVSFDSGRTWQDARATSGPSRPAHLAVSYFHPMPAGVQDVRLKLSEARGYGGPFSARDFSIWSSDTADASAISLAPPAQDSGPAPSQASQEAVGAAGAQGSQPRASGGAPGSWWAALRKLAFD